MDYFQGLVNDGAKFNKRARSYLTDKGVSFGGGGGGGRGDDEDTNPTPTSTPTSTSNS